MTRYHLRAHLPSGEWLTVVERRTLREARSALVIFTPLRSRDDAGKVRNCQLRIWDDRDGEWVGEPGDQVDAFEVVSSGDE